MRFHRLIGQQCLTPSFLQQENPLAPFSALVSFTSREKLLRLMSDRSWLKMLAFRSIIAGLLGRFGFGLSHPNSTPFRVATSIYFGQVCLPFSHKAHHFNYDQGVADAHTALALAESLDQPEGSAIYFAIDFDATPDENRLKIKPYFQGVNDTIADCLIGCYGSGLSCEYLSCAGLVTYTWLPFPPGWRGSSNYSDWNIHQTTNNSGLCNKDADLDVLQSADADFGGYQFAQ